MMSDEEEEETHLDEEDVDIDAEGDDVNGAEKEKVPDEIEPVPAWIRYMPKKLQNQPKIDDAAVELQSGGGTELQLMNSMQVPVLVPIKPSSNRFGPTSLKARSQKRMRTNASSAPYTQPEQRTSSQRMKDKLNRCNINEAEMLFSMTGIAKK